MQYVYCTVFQSVDNTYPPWNLDQYLNIKVLMPFCGKTVYNNVLIRMENYTSRTCLNCERVNLFLVASEIASGVGHRVK